MINNAHQSVSYWGNVLTIPKVQNQTVPIRMFSASDRPDANLEFGADGAKADAAGKTDEKQIEEKPADEAAEEEDDKDSEEIHERFRSETFDVTSDIKIEAIGEPQFKVIQELDGLTNQYILDQMNVNRHKDEII